VFLIFRCIKADGAGFPQSAISYQTYRRITLSLVMGVCIARRASPGGSVMMPPRRRLPALAAALLPIGVAQAWPATIGGAPAEFD